MIVNFSTEKPHFKNVSFVILSLSVIVLIFYFSFSTLKMFKV